MKIEKKVYVARQTLGEVCLIFYNNSPRKGLLRWQ